MEEVKVLLMSGIIIYVIKSFSDFYIRKKELRNNTFYEIKTKKVIELHKKIIDIKILVERGSYPLNIINKLENEQKKSFGRFKYEMDRDYWESDFYYSKETCAYLKLLIRQLSFHSTPEFIKENPNIEPETKEIISKLLFYLKEELKK